MMEAGETAAPVNILEDDNEEEIESGEDFLEKDSRTLPIVKHGHTIMVVAVAITVSSMHNDLYKLLALPSHPR